MADEEIQRGTTKRQIARLIGNATVPMYVLGDDDRILFANDALAELLRLDLDQLIGLDCSKNIPSDPSPRTLLATSLALPPNTDRSRVQLQPILLPDASQRWLRVAFPIDESAIPMVFCAIKRDGGDMESLMDGVPRAKLQQVLARFLSEPAKATDLWFLCGSSPWIVRTRKQIHAAIAGRSGIHVIGPSSSSLAVAKSIALQRSTFGAAPGSRLPFLVVECRRMDSELLRSALEMIDNQCRKQSRPQVFPSVILHQIDELPDVLIDSICDWSTTSKGLLIATSSTVDLLGRHPNHPGWGTLVATVDAQVVQVPALSQRIGDIESLVAAWLELANETGDGKEKVRWTREFLDGMLAYSWPEDIAEFDEVLRSAVQRCAGQRLTDQELPIALRTYPSHSRRPEPHPKIELDSVLEQVERELIQKAIESFPRNRTAAANHLGISRARFLRRLQQLGLQQPGPNPRVDSEEPIFEEWDEDFTDRDPESNRP